VRYEGHEPPSRFREILFTFKHKLESNIENVMPEPESTFMKGITLGSRAGLSKELRDQFVTTGTIHIVALSGYNITIVADGIQKFFSLFLSKYAAFGVGAFSIILFVLMTGAQSTAVRAGVMAILAIVARSTGKQYMATRALFLAGLIMTIANPETLLSDVSFALSFIATLGLIHLTPITERWIGFRNSKRVAWFREIIATTLAAQIAVLPYILYAMGTLSIVSFPLNILILPFMPIAMFLGFGASVFGFLGIWASSPFGIAGNILLDKTLDLISFSARIPHASVGIRVFPFWAMIGTYAVLVFLVIRHTQKSASLVHTSDADFKKVF